MPTPLTITQNTPVTYGSTTISGDGDITITGNDITVQSGTITFGSVVGGAAAVSPVGSLSLDSGATVGTFTTDGITVVKGSPITLVPSSASVTYGTALSGSVGVTSSGSINSSVVAAGTLSLGDSHSITITPDSTTVPSGSIGHDAAAAGTFTTDGITVVKGSPITLVPSSTSVTYGTPPSGNVGISFSGSINSSVVAAGTLSLGDSHSITTVGAPITITPNSTTVTYGELPAAAHTSVGTGASITATSTVNTLAPVSVGSLSLGNIFSTLAKNKYLLGTAKDDVLVGGTGNDILSGLGGNDKLISNGGHDTLTGGRGADVFVVALHNTTQHSTITDFTKGSDHINLIGESFDHLVFKSLNGGTDITDKTLGTDSGHLFLSHINPHSITASDFIFS